jgi:hypothetical protein
MHIRPPTTLAFSELSGGSFFGHLKFYFAVLLREGAPSPQPAL